MKNGPQWRTLTANEVSQFREGLRLILDRLSHGDKVERELALRVAEALSDAGPGYAPGAFVGMDSEGDAKLSVADTERWALAVLSAGPEEPLNSK